LLKPEIENSFGKNESMEKSGKELILCAAKLRDDIKDRTTDLNNFQNEILTAQRYYLL
jgi:hypothetical protein